jgi:hypothetical protein
MRVCVSVYVRVGGVCVLLVCQWLLKKLYKRRRLFGTHTSWIWLPLHHSNGSHHWHQRYISTHTLQRPTLNAQLSQAITEHQPEDG